MPLFQQPQLQTFGEADMQDEELLAELGELENEAMQEAAAAGGVPAVVAAANTEGEHDCMAVVCMRIVGTQGLLPGDISLRRYQPLQLLPYNAPQLVPYNSLPHSSRWTI